MLPYSGCRLIRASSVDDLAELLSGPSGVKPAKLAVTVGNFDGLHLGHQSLISTLKPVGSPTAMLTFYPHPQDFFGGTSSPRLFTLRERFLRVADQGINYFILLRFDRRLAALSADEFVQQVLVQGLNISKIAVGSEWRYGSGRSGTVDSLRVAGEQFGFTVETPLLLGADGKKLSSSDLKRVLAEGDLAAYKKLTGRDYEYCGRVVSGDKRGRQIGFRTANLSSRKDLITVKNGVYKTISTIIGESGEYPSITNVGVRPTVCGSSSRVVVETHLLGGFSREIYSHRMRVRFIDRIRDEKKFSSIDELKAQIARDIASSNC